MNIEVELAKFDLNEDAVKEISSRLQPTTIKKKEYFIEEGKTVIRIGLLISGLLIARYCDKDGKIFTTKFYYENGHRIVTDYKNFLSGTPAQESIVAVEDSHLLTITKQDFIELTESLPGFERMSKQLVEDNYLYALERVRQLQTLPKSKIVSNFYQQHQGLFNRVSKTDIASYLGMHRNMLTKALKNI